MSRFRRKTAPGVRDGQTRRKNNWRPSPSCYTVPQLVPTIDRRRPGPGYRHVLLKRDIERFVQLIPDWSSLAVGLDVIVLAEGRIRCDGWYNRGVIGLPAWPTNMRYGVSTQWFRAHNDFLLRIEAHIEIHRDDPNDIVIHWSLRTARAYQLCHVFLHELGHHRDRMSTRSKIDNAPRGEDFAEEYAWKHEMLIWEHYLAEFGLPE